MNGDLKKFFNPRSVAVIGASRSKGSPGYTILENLLFNKRKGVFKGEIYPVNPKAQEIQGVKCYSSVLDIPSKIDLAVISTPAKIIPKLIGECGTKKIKHVIVVSGGFNEVGNQELTDKLKESIERNKVRLIGPNCLGVINLHKGLDTSFIPVFKKTLKGEKVTSAPRPKKGYMTLLSQSGAFGTAALDYLYSEKIGINVFVSYGNKLDVDEPTLLNYFLEDEDTHVILMYVESLERGRDFVETAKKVTLTKPVVVLKAGKSPGGSKAASSHTGALAGMPEIYAAVFKQTGVISATGMEDLFDKGKALLYQPPAEKDSVAILTNAGGPGVLAADAVELQNLKLTVFAEETMNKLYSLVEEGVIVPYASLHNPVDLSGSATIESYIEAMKVLLEAEEVGAIILFPLHHPPSIEQPETLALELSELINKYRKTVVACKIGGSRMSAIVEELLEKREIPVYPSPERGVKSLKGLVFYGEWLRKHNLLSTYLKKFWKLKEERQKVDG